MDPDLRAEIDAVSREHDRMMAHAREPVGGPYVRREGPAGLLYREHEESAPAPASATDSALFTAVADESARNAAAWDAWVRGHIEVERAEIFDQMGKVVAEFTSGYVFERLQPLTREIAGLKGENAELRGMLGSALTALDAVRKSAEAIHRERQDEKRDFAIRNQVIAERSDRIAQLQRENFESRSALAQAQLSQAFGQRDARIERIEERMQMLLRFLSLSVDLPRGFGRTDDA
jgi:hypothetical protein